MALLVSRAGVPSWGPELLARTYYALGSGVSTIDTLPDLYRTVGALGGRRRGEPHDVPAARPLPLAAAVLVVGDLAARGTRLGRAHPFARARTGADRAGQALPAQRVRMPEPGRPGDGHGRARGGRPGRRDHPDLRGVPRRPSPGWHEVGFPITREAADAWPDFVGWRVNYESAAYQIAAAIDAVPALWSGPRRHAMAEIAPRRPPSGRQRHAERRSRHRRIYDPSLIVALCWPHDRGVAQRRRATGLAYLPADELAASRRPQPAAAAGLRAHAAGVRGARRSSARRRSTGSARSRSATR